MKTPVRVAVTGAAGQISYSLLFRIASGQMLGLDQQVIFQLLEITPAMKALEGVVMEIDDCAFPLVEDFILTALSLQNNNTAFIDKSQSERKDLLAQFLALPSTRANRQYGNSLADENLLRTLVRRNHAEPYINA